MTDVDPRVRRTHARVREAAGALLLDEGWPAVTHARVAEVTGASKATLYAHWPTPLDLVREAFASIGEIPHHQPTGDLRADLVGETAKFRWVLADRGFDRVLAGLAERAMQDEEIAEVRDEVVADGAAVMRGVLADHGIEGEAAEVVTSHLLGAVIYRVVVAGLPLPDELVGALVDASLAGIGR